MYAVIRSGGKQYTVREGETVQVELLKTAPGEQLEMDQVLAVGEGADLTIGHPIVAGAKVVAEVLDHGRGEKIIVYKYKAKTRYHRKTGHRQAFTRLAIREIVAP